MYFKNKLASLASTKCCSSSYHFEILKKLDSSLLCLQKPILRLSDSLQPYIQKTANHFLLLVTAFADIRSIQKDGKDKLSATSTYIGSILKPNLKTITSEWNFAEEQASREISGVLTDEQVHLILQC